MKKSVIVITIMLISIILVILGTILGTRYYNYKDLIGKYELVEGEGLNPLNLNLYKWSFGKREDLECDLWDCTGYENGEIYRIENNKIKFTHDKHFSYIYGYSIKNEGKNTYIILDDNGEIIKYKKIK